METELSTPGTRREKEVWQACDDLWAQTASSRHLTGDNIRDRLVLLGYKRGSPNEIYRYRNSWKQSRGISDTQDEPEAESRGSDPISRAVSLVYDQMRSQTSEAIEKLTEDYETRLKTTLLEQETLKDLLHNSQNEKASLVDQLRQALADLENARESLTKERNEQAVLNERLKGMQSQLDNVGAEQRALIAELKAFHEREVDLWRGQNTDLQKAMAEQKKLSLAEAERQGAIFSDELMKLKTELRQVGEARMRAETKLAIVEGRAEQDAHRTKELEELLKKQHVESRGWHRKLERELQSRKSRSLQMSKKALRG